MEVNHSIAGTETQKLSLFNKIGIGTFVAGILGLIELISIVALDKKKYSVTQVENHEAFILASFGLMLIGIFLFTYKKQQRKLHTIFFRNVNVTQKIGLLISWMGFGILALAWMGIKLEPATLYLWLSMSAMSAGILIYTYGSYAGHPKGIKNNHVMMNSLTNKGVLGWIAGIVLTLFYIQLYWFPESLQGLTQLFDPLSYIFTGGKASQWFVYGTMYTLLITFLGIKFIIKYRKYC